jgi:copper resistance protein C
MRRAGMAATAVLVAVVAVLGVAGPASAHNQVTALTPAADSTLTQLPATFGITTNLPFLDVSGDGAGFAFEVRSSAGKYYGDGCITIQDNTMSVKPAIGPAGDYTVVWQFVSQDGHALSGSYPFTWKPSGSFTPSTAHDAPQNCGRAAGPKITGTAVPDPNAERSQTVPLGDVLWIGGALVAVALAVVVTLLVLTRRRRSSDTDGDDQSRANRERNPQ